METTGRKVVFVDMDGVLADFDGQCEAMGLAPKEAKNRANFFRDLPVLPGALENVALMAARFNLYVATSPTWSNPYSFTEKLHWLERNFPALHADRKVFIVPDKSLLRGDVLIDDHPEWNNAHKFDGQVITFAGDWREVWEELPWRS